MNDKSMAQMKSLTSGSWCSLFFCVGDVTAVVLYVNYGRIEDYEALEKLNISVAGKVSLLCLSSFCGYGLRYLFTEKTDTQIVLVRYGMIFRGAKVMIAEEKGAIGVIIYSDPADDGYSRGIARYILH